MTVKQVKLAPRVLWQCCPTMGSVSLQAEGMTDEQKSALYVAVVNRLDAGTGRWVSRGNTYEGRESLLIRQPRGGAFGGPALREQVKLYTRYVRDALKHALREAGHKGVR